MRLLDWIFSRTPTETSPPPDVQLPPSIFSPPDIQVLEKEDEREVVIEISISVTEHKDRSTSQSLTDSAVIDLGDTFCIIEYVDSGGTATRRRVTLQSMKPGPVAPLVNAICHERRAFRNFRADRIASVITEDGEVLTPLDFFTATFGEDIAEALVSAQPAPKKERPVRIEAAGMILADHLRPALAILVGAARADTSFHPNELDVIEVYVENEALHLRNKGVLADLPSTEDLDAISTMVQRMRPQRRTMERHIEEASEWDKDRLRRLAKTLGKVVVADGVVRDAETAFVEEVERLMVH